MILNPSHEITLSGLPSDVLNAYVRYKKGSRAIVSWLVRYGPSNYKGVKTLPIKELAALARKVSAQIKHLPDVIHFHFQETIAARKRLSKYFRKNRDDVEHDFDTINHEHFTHSLSEIYQELCERCQNASKIRKLPQEDGVDIARKLRNHYDCLPVEDTTSLESALLDLKIDCTECGEDHRLLCPVQDTSVEIGGDDLAVAIETVVLLDVSGDHAQSSTTNKSKQAQNILDTIEHSWMQAGRGDLSFVAVAGATNSAWRSLCSIASQLEVIYPEISIDAIHSRCCHLSGVHKTSLAQTDSLQQHKLLKALKEAERSVKHYIDGHKLKVIRSCAACVQKPADYIQLPGEMNAVRTNNLQVALLDNIFHLINRASGYPTLVLASTPCLTEVGQLLSHPADARCNFKCTVIVHLLAKAYEAYLTTCAKPSAISMCRIVALRLAQQAAVSVNTVLMDKYAFPCQCPQTLAFHLSNLEHDLNGFAKHKCWDLYVQSPWVTGTHVIEMLDILGYYGMRLFHYRHFVGSILHTYNVIQQLAELEPIRALDDICQTFEELFFPAGGKPTVSFKNSWSRFVGARLQFKRGHKGHDHRESWCMAIPAHAAKTAAGFGTNSKSQTLDPKFNYGRFDALVKLKQQGYILNVVNENLPPLSNPSNSRAFSISRPSTSASSTDDGSSMSISDRSTISTIEDPSSDHEHVDDHQHHPLNKLANHLDASLHGQGESWLPPTRLNLFAIFATCNKIVSKISDRVHPAPESESDTNSNSENKNCICYTTTLLAGADRIVEGRKLGRLECWKKNERELIEIVKSVMLEVMADVEQDRNSWLWNI